MDGMGDNSVSITIEHDDGSFEVVSTGQYGQTKRRIEATFAVADGRPDLLSWRELYE